MLLRPTDRECSAPTLDPGKVGEFLGAKKPRSKAGASAALGAPLRSLNRARAVLEAYLAEFDSHMTEQGCVGGATNALRHSR